jgi:hypothetical protein
MTDAQEKEMRPLRIALLAIEAMAYGKARGVSLSFDECVRGYGRDVGVTPEMARAAIIGPLRTILDEIESHSPYRNPERST